MLTISASELNDRRKQAILLPGNMTQIEIGKVVGVGRYVICGSKRGWRPKGFKTRLLGSSGQVVGL